jgi:hypothetical protein
MNLLEASAHAEKRINSSADALAIAIEMLDAIKGGHSYGSFEYLAMLYRMKQFAPRHDEDADGHITEGEKATGTE